jgi:L-alanine-DL-glutamate epimerase-like enolase superfamily enzyme
MTRIRRLRAHVFRWRTSAPVRTSFGVMFDRPMVLVEAQGDDGLSGWGEIWCNFPAVGAEHRARLVESVLAHLVEGATASPERMFEILTERVRILALQSGEHGPFAQCIAGVDIALWDLAARRAGEPLWRFLGGTNPEIRVYASGLNPERPAELAEKKRSQGYTAFKLKVGFGRERDLDNLASLRSALGTDVRLMADANQGWTFEDAAAMGPEIARFGLDWLEEPLPADTPLERWKALAAQCPVPLAAGENMASAEAFDTAIASRAFAVLQPDMAKWGGFSGCRPVARKILAGSLRYCPHFLGGGIGLLASAHLLAAAGGDGMLEIDANPNPLRSELCGTLAGVHQGKATLDEAPGLGVTPDIASLGKL